MKDRATVTLPKQRLAAAIIEWRLEGSSGMSFAFTAVKYMRIEIPIQRVRTSGYQMIRTRFQNFQIFSHHHHDRLCIGNFFYRARARRIKRVLGQSAAATVAAASSSSASFNKSENWKLRIEN